MKPHFLPNCNKIANYMPQNLLFASLFEQWIYDTINHPKMATYFVFSSGISLQQAYVYLFNDSVIYRIIHGKEFLKVAQKI